MSNNRSRVKDKNLDYKDLVRIREEKKKQLLNNKNPFILTIPTTNQEVYEGLFKFDAKTALDEYALPLGKEEEKQKDKLQGQGKSVSQLDGSLGGKSKKGLSQLNKTDQNNDQEVFENDESRYSDRNMGGSEIRNNDENQVQYNQIVMYLLDPNENNQLNQQPQTTKIQNAQFVDRNVQTELNKIISGEDAISFFAKYGNTTPIKFVNCVRKLQEDPTIFRPYDLVKTHYKENQKEQALDEYYTISANGIVHVWTDKGKKKAEGDTSTEVISLSDWMHESTMFNIITNIQFFKNYVISKIYNLWKANVRYRIYCRTRQKLVHENFITKPSFVNHLLEVNRLMFDLQQHKTLGSLNNQQSTYDLERFKTEQKSYRTQTAATYEGIIEKVMGVCQTVANEVIERTKVKDQTEIEEGRFGQQVKQKPMNEIRLENEEREYLLDRALKDKDKLKLFVRMIDYIVVEQLFSVNQVSMQMLLDEMNKSEKQRKHALFNSNVEFNTVGMTYQPDCKAIEDTIQSQLEDMINVVSTVNRVIDKIDNYVKMSNNEKKMNLKVIIEKSQKFTQIQQSAISKVQNDFKLVELYVDTYYEKCREINDFDKNNVQSEDIIKDETSLDEIKDKINKLKNWQDVVQQNIKDVPKGVIQISGGQMKTKLQNNVKNTLQKIKEKLRDILLKKQNDLRQKLEDYVKDLNKAPSDLKSNIDYIKRVNDLKEEAGTDQVTGKDNKQDQNKLDKNFLKQKNDIETMHFEFKSIESSGSNNNYVQFLNDSQITLEIIKKKYEELFIDQANLDEKKNFQQDQENYNKKDPSQKCLLKQAIEIVNENSKQNDKLIQQEVEVQKQKIIDTISQVNSNILVNKDTPPQEALARLNQIKNMLDQINTRDKQLQEYQKTMDPTKNVKGIAEFNELLTKYNDRRTLWQHIENFNNYQQEWMHGNFMSLDAEFIEKEMSKFNSTLLRLKAGMSGNKEAQTEDPVFKMHQIRVHSFQKYQPIILALANKDLQDRHWEKIFKKFGQQYQPNMNFSFQNLLDYKVDTMIEEVEEISARASGEMGLVIQIDEISKKWQELFFEVKSYRESKDKFIIGSVEDIIASLDDHQLKVQTMLGTRFVTEIRSKVEMWEARLLLIQETIDEWLYCQKQWMYLENIFSAEDIQKQLPAETTNFQKVDKFWREIMVKTNKRPLVVDCCNSKDLRVKFENANKSLEDIQKCLENYLETKRGAFPRFYFLSNDELLEILSQTRNPHAVQGHLRKCFDNINRIHFTQEEESREIISMQSAEPETQPEIIPFTKSVFSEGAVEHWLMKIQEMMIQTLYDLTRLSYFEYPSNGLERKDWLFKYPAQPILTVDLIKWTEGCEQAIVKAGQGQANAVGEFYEFMKELITVQVGIVRLPLDTLQRTMMGALIVLDVHARDVVKNMVQVDLKSLNDFEWSKQLRYYWEMPEKDGQGDCIVKQTNSRFHYSYEYLGNGPRLVITPLTDKCYITLTSGKHLQYGGAPAGPAGTGKTETTKDLAKALAVQCVVFNCSDGLDFKTMGRFFSGLAQGGAWACFDEFNRIDIEVLSVIAQQILTIQQAIRSKFEIFNFEGRDIPLNARFGVFITMNPGYAGRTELPDNLKALFRPVAMMIPDYRLIAEIILFSEGFETASILASKMVKLYSLSSEQLSKQDHYDFGMRAVKSVLVMAGALRRKHSDLGEDIVLIRAMRDSNIPKFLSHDLPLFQGIIQDLFPSVHVPNIDYGALQNSIENQLTVINYQKPKLFVGKIIQLMETMMVRHGVMLVGLASTGKTTNLTTLSKALLQMNQEGSQDFWHKPVKVEKLNPKSVTMNELFGYTNLLTNEWTDGIAAKLIRDNVKDTSDVKKWIVFDGPVDALWIENMNTVLDDNKMLCLNNGQRIKLPVTFTMIFEVNDLAVASPATVSRCGMVYMEPLHLGWEPLIDTWQKAFEQKNLDSDQKIPVYIANIIERTRTFFLEYFAVPEMRQSLKEVIQTVNNNLVNSCINLINVLTEQCKDETNNFEGLTNPEREQLCAMIFIFSFIWSAGGNLHDNPQNPKDNYRQKFSQQIRSKILKIYSAFPYEGEVYDYYPNFRERQFKTWQDKVEEFKYIKDMPYFNILVPTQDTAKYKYLLNILVERNVNLLLMGETGVGKSVIVGDFLMNLDKEKYVFTALNFSAQTSSKNLQDLFMDKDKFQRKKKDLVGPPSGKKMIVFVDDINMPALEKFGAQPVNELLRQIIDHGGFYDMKKLFFVHVKDLVFVSCCASPGGGRNQVTARLFRHFNMIWQPDLSQKSMETIFTQILKGFLGVLGTKQEKNAQPIVKQTVDLYFNITTQLLPTPKKSHYTFNLRDISKVFQGMLMSNENWIKQKQQLVQLWTHECYRVFSDRLIDDDDRQWFTIKFGEYLKKIEGDDQPVEPDIYSNYIFGDFYENDKEYKLFPDIEKELPRILVDRHLAMYNAGSNVKQMNLVFFRDAIKHLARVCRVLRQNRGNSLLIGVGGSGRQSLTRLATSINQQALMSIEITKNYKDPQWKDDLKKLLKQSGQKPTTFLFSDTQIVKESFLEDINNLLNIGEVPNLWATEDYEEILTDIRPQAKEKGIQDSRDHLLKFFVLTCRENLHIVLAFSPVGEKLRNRLRMFPSIINCCAVDWFDKWPDEALQSVALKEYKAQDKLGINNYVNQLSEISVKIHTDVINYSEDFYETLRRRNYVTPTSYLELIKLFIDMMKFQQNNLPIQINKFTVGLETLDSTNKIVGKLQQQIIEFKPKLEQMTKDNEKLVTELTEKTKIANESEVICLKDTNEAQIIRDNVSEQRQSCQKDLDEALPIQKKAQAAVKQIDKNMINELKAFQNPHNAVKMVMNSCCLLFGLKEDWETAKKSLLGDMAFLENLQKFDLDTVSEAKWKKFKQVYINNEDYNEATIETKSKAALAIYTWAVNLERYYQARKIVVPKQKKLEEAESELKEVETKLNQKQSQLKEIQDMVSDLQKNLETSTRKQQIFEDQKREAEIKLQRAEKLLGGLSGEAVRWKESVKKLTNDLNNLTGNIILAAANISYLGPFTSEFRKRMNEDWIKECQLKDIPVSKDFSLENILSDEVQIREWQENGLPSDNLSIENGIFIFQCKRWPLIIDPQGQANKWIKNMGSDSNIMVTKLTEPSFLKTLENAIRFGQSVLLENVEEDLDPSLEPILLKQTFKKGPQLFLRLGDQDIPFSNQFKFYLTTKLPNPHYIPEIAIKTTIINFTVTPSGLEDQLLAEVVRFERIELEETRISLILEISQCKRQLQELQDKILRQIGEAGSKILDDEELISTLDTSKVTYETVNTRLEQSKVTSQTINTTRELYRPVAKRGSVLYFVIAGLSNIDPMYQYSLEYFIKIFKIRLEKAPNPSATEYPDQNERLQARLLSLINDMTEALYVNICRGLFEKDKVLYSFLMAVNIQIEKKKINIREWNFFLRGPTQDIPLDEDQKIPEWSNEKQMKQIISLSKESSAFADLPNAVNDPNEQEKWKNINDVKQGLWDVQLPASLQNLEPFSKLLFFKQFREEKLLVLIKKWVGISIGESFTYPPLFDLKGSFNDSTCTTPIIFVLSPGADPISYLINLAKEKEYYPDRLKMLSLGQGQGDIARELIKAGRRNGDWVCLQNCHLAISWMTDLERIQEMQVEADTHPDYRLWLTSMPSTKFPVPVLQSGIKLTNEPPKGMRANVSRSMNEVDEKIYEGCKLSFEYKKLLYSLAFFHAVILERRKFGAIGWNIQYEWMNSDFETCQLQLLMYLNEQPDVPWQTLNYLFAEVNYGGRVTDDKDVRLITALLTKYFNPDVLIEGYEFAPGGVYKSPSDLQLQAVKEYVQKLPTDDDPQVFGLHSNANITYEKKIVGEFLITLIEGQPRGGSAKGLQKPEDIIKSVAEKMLNELPKPIKLELHDNSTLNSLQIFRQQEVQQFNRLLSVMKKTVSDLIKAIEGTVVMSLQLEMMFNSFLLKRVPEQWENVAYPSLKPLGSWMIDYQMRMEFFQKWANQDHMESYWISAMFFPQGFMTSAMQQYARKTHIAIDTLTFRTEVRKFYAQEAKEIPENGVNVHGLYIEGCRWNINEGNLDESRPQNLFEEVPCILLDPVQINDFKKSGYQCPLYKTSTRKGTLSTTGHSTNFVMYLDLKSKVNPDHWVRRGVALLTMLDD